MKNRPAERVSRCDDCGRVNPLALWSLVPFTKGETGIALRLCGVCLAEWLRKDQAAEAHKSEARNG